MVKNIINVATFLVTVGILLLSGCLQPLEYPPKFKKGALPDTISIYKNGYRTFYLDSLIADKDDASAVLRWTISPGPLLEVRVKKDTSKGSLVEIAPERNQTGMSSVTFTVVDPGGLSASKTCAVLIKETDFKWQLGDTTIATQGRIARAKSGIVDYFASDYLQWNVYVDTHFLIDSSKTNSVILKAKNNAGKTGVYFRLTDTLNHIDFHQSILVIIQ